MSILVPPQGGASAIAQDVPKALLKTPVQYFAAKIQDEIVDPILGSQDPVKAFEDRLPQYGKLLPLFGLALELELKPGELIKLYEKIMRDYGVAFVSSILRSKFRNFMETVYENDILLLTSLLHRDPERVSEASKVITSYPNLAEYLDLLDRCSLVMILVIRGTEKGIGKATEVFVNYGGKLAEELETHVATLQVLLNPELASLRKKLSGGERSPQTKLRGSLLEIRKRRI